VTSQYSLREETTYAVEVATLRSPESRTGGVPAPVQIEASLDTAGIIRIVGAGSIDVRQYTGDHLKLECPHLDSLRKQPTSLLLSTKPRDGDWPTGPELRFGITVRKRPSRLALGTLAGIAGLALAADGVSTALGRASAQNPVVAIVGGIVLMALAAMALTGKPQVTL
jgi:hypothetical protein